VDDLVLAARSPIPDSVHLPSGVLAESIPRHLGVGMADSAGMISGQLASASIILPAGLLVSKLKFFSATTAAVNPTNQWFCLFDRNRNVLGVTSDDTTTAWASNAPKELTLATPYRIPQSDVYYGGIMVKADTVPTLRGQTGTSAQPATLPPNTQGLHDTGLTTPASLPSPVATFGSLSRKYYFQVL
jgi:hypothetical protein